MLMEFPKTLSKPLGVHFTVNVSVNYRESIGSQHWPYELVVPLLSYCREIELILHTLKNISL